LLNLIDSNMLLFVTASLVLISAPGQDNIYIITRGIAQGRRAAFFSAWGVCCGLLVHTAFAAIGLSALLAHSAVAFSVVKYAGAAYLIYLGIRTLLSKESFVVSGEETPATGLGKVFLQGVVSNVLNPKVALFFLAFLPQFVNPASGSAAAQFLILGLLFVVLALILTTLIAYFSGALGDWLKDRPGLANKLRWLTGSVLVGLGMRLAFADRR
jgi:threonine/homoserine/homoserine lactone efflux protein